MVTWWKEGGVSSLSDLLNKINSSNSYDYYDQVVWSTMAKVSNVSESDVVDDQMHQPIGFIPLGHKNFSHIIASVLRKNPDTIFRYIEKNLLNVKLLNDLIGPIVNPGDPCPGSGGATREQLEIVSKISFALEVMAQGIIGVIGIILNMVAMYLLSTNERLKSVFNKTVFCLLLIHTIFILSSILMEVYKMSPSSVTFDWFFCNFIYPSKPILLYTSTFITVLMARERFRAVRHPVEYRNANVGHNLWKKPVLQTLISFVVSCAFVTPLLFESKIVWKQERTVSTYNDTHSVEALHHYPAVVATDLLLRYEYVFWYKNLATFTFTAFIPLALLAYWNLNTIRLMRRRFDSVQQSAASAATGLISLKVEEEGKAKILFTIIVIFFVCNTFRFIVILEECFANRDKKYADEHQCVPFPFWVMIINRISHLMLTINASIGSVIYCIMSRDFKVALSKALSNAFARMNQIFRSVTDIHMFTQCTNVRETSLEVASLSVPKIETEDNPVQPNQQNHHFVAIEEEPIIVQEAESGVDESATASRGKNSEAPKLSFPQQQRMDLNNSLFFENRSTSLRIKRSPYNLDKVKASHIIGDFRPLVKSATNLWGFGRKQIGNGLRPGRAEAV